MNKSIYRYNLGQLFDQVAEKQSHKDALLFVDGLRCSYGCLNETSNRIANLLFGNGIRKNDVIAIFNNKTVISYAVMLACLKIGAIYTNLDSKSPEERFSRMILICKPKAFFYYSDEHESYSVAQPSMSETVALNYTSDEFVAKVKNASDLFPTYNSEVTANTPAYIMFTSGSTGFPKGVVITHANVLNFIDWSKQTYGTTESDRFTNVNPMHFDNSVFDFYSSLFTGASLIPVNEFLTRNPRRLVDSLNGVSPTIWFSVPSMLVYMLNLRALRESDLQTLRIVSFGGEGFPKNQLRLLWQKWGKRIVFLNVYGPTECTCICSSYSVAEEDMERDDLLPLGPIAPNFYAVVVNEAGEPVIDGEIGELCIGGPNVGLGYYNDMRKTSESFVNNPAIDTHRDIVYKSGDLVKHDRNKNVLHFCGRKDNQIKRMGYRIELEEIENALSSLACISESAVVFIDSEKQNGAIIACLCSEEKNLDVISSELSKYLPLYMMPDKYKYYEFLPKNQNGKIDRLKLKEEVDT